MDIDAFMASLAASPLAQYISQSTYAFPTIESLHVIAVAAVFGSISIVDLRLVGLVGNSWNIKTLTKDLLPLTWLGFVLAVITGTLMFLSNATGYWANVHFRLKFAALLLAGVNMLLFELVTARSMKDWEQSDGKSLPPAVKLAGALSLLFWILVVIFGRWIGFSISAFGFPMS